MWGLGLGDLRTQAQAGKEQAGQEMRCLRVVQLGDEGPTLCKAVLKKKITK